MCVISGAYALCAMFESIVSHGNSISIINAGS